MSDDPNRREPEPTDPIEAARKGLGLLFRAAKATIEQLPKQKLEDVVLTGVREVGRAIENVTQTLDRQFFKRENGDASRAASASPKADASPSPSEVSKEAPKEEPPPEPRDPPRVG